MSQAVWVSTATADRALSELAAPLPLDELVPGPGEWEVEIGFGKGRYLVRRCEEDPDRARMYYALYFGPLATGLANELAKHADSLGGCCWRDAGRQLADAGIIDAERVDAFAANLHGLTLVYTVALLYRGTSLEPDLASRLVNDLLRGFALPAGTRL